MNTERLHEICVEVKGAIESTGLVDRLNRVSTCLQNVVNQSQSPEHQTELSAALNDLYAVLEDFPTDSFSPAWRQVLDEIGAADILGEALLRRVHDAVERNQITPATALEEIQAILADLQRFKAAIDSMVSACDQLGIGRDSLEPGECELGVLIPRDAVAGGFREFTKELADLSFVFGTFSELASGNQDKLEVRTVSSSDLMVFLAATPPVAACVAAAAERLVNLYKTLLEIKKLKADLKQQGLNEKELAGVSKHANKVMSDGIDELALELVSGYYAGQDEGRKNELTNAVRISLRKLANKIDVGFNIEVRAAPIAEVSDDSEDDGEKALVRQQVQIVIDASGTLQFIRSDGERILHLPESCEEQ